MKRISISTILVVCLFCFIGCMKDHEGDPVPPIGPPPSEVVFTLSTTSGETTLPADNESTLELEASLTDQNENPWIGVAVYFSCSLGTISPSEVTTILRHTQIFYPMQ